MSVPTLEREPSAVYEAASVPPPEALDGYGRSQSAFRHLGETMLAGCEISGGAERKEAARQAAWDEYQTAILERVRRLIGGEVSRLATYKLVGDDLVARDGETKVGDIFENGYQAALREAEAEEAADKTPRMYVEAERAWYDRENGTAVTRMTRGETPYNTRIGCSMSPEEALQTEEDKDYWKNKIGYEPGLSYIQLFHTEPGSGEMTAGTFSINAPNHVLVAAAQAEGVPLPSDVHGNKGLAHVLESTMDLEQALEVVARIRERCRLLQEKETVEASAARELARQSAVLEINFALVAEPLAVSVASGKKTPELHQFIEEISRQPLEDMDPAVRREIIRILNRQKFDGQSAEVASELMYYAVMAQIDQNITKQRANAMAVQQVVEQPAPLIAAELTGVISIGLDMQMRASSHFRQSALRNAASSLSGSISAGKQYGGGCQPAMKLNGSDSGAGDEPGAETQEAFGRVAKADREAGSDNEVCDFVSAKCPECGKSNVRTRSEIIIKRGIKYKRVTGRSSGCKCRKEYLIPAAA